MEERRIDQIRGHVMWLEGQRDAQGRHISLEESIIIDLWHEREYWSKALIQLAKLINTSVLPNEEDL